MSMLQAEVHRMETKTLQIFNDSHNSTLVGTAHNSLTSRELSRWRESVAIAPTAFTVRSTRNIHLSRSHSTNSESLIEKLTSVMMFDMYGLLLLILYEDSREEIVNSAVSASAR